MAGHSKWANIQHRKNRQDIKRSKIWTKLIREITISSREGGPDFSCNPKLRIACEKANDVNMPKDNIQRAISRGSNIFNSLNYNEIRYEGYGISGSAVLIDAITDNKARTASEIRHLFNKYGGNLGQDGSVSFLFNYYGKIVFPPDISEYKIIDVTMDYAVEDIIIDDYGFIEVLCLPKDYNALSLLFKNVNLKSEIECFIMKPINKIQLNIEDETKFKKMMEELESIDDVQEIYSNVVFDKN